MVWSSCFEWPLLISLQKGVSCMCSTGMCEGFSSVPRQIPLNLAKIQLTTNLRWLNLLEANATKEYVNQSGAHHWER